MNLLIVTQKVDRSDAVLGFMHGWIEHLAAVFEQISVICLEKGEVVLPTNVRVLSLWKEEGRSRLKYTIRFYRFLWRERREYNGVLIHMNPEYVILGGLFWRAWGKRVVFWYNHTYGTWRARVAMKLAHIICHTSPYSFTAGTKKSVRMPAGVDCDLFTVQSVPRRSSALLSVGRIAPVKNVHVLAEAAKLLSLRRVSCTLDIYGDALPRDEEYLKKIKGDSFELLKKEMIIFHGSISHHETPVVYSGAQVFVNLTPKGNFDKTVLEAMACGTLVVTSSIAFADVLPKDRVCAENDAEALSVALENTLALSEKEKQSERNKNREYVSTHQSLDALLSALKNIFNVGM